MFVLVVGGLPLRGGESIETGKTNSAEVTADEEDNDDGTVIVAAPTSAMEVLYGTISRLPNDPVTLYGTLTVRKPHGVGARTIPFSMALEWGAQPPCATYELQDGFGRVDQILKIEHPKNQPMKLAAYDGEGKPLEKQPKLTDSVRGTDFSWLDISLAFLWWDDAELKGEDSFRGSLCDLVDVKPPVKIDGCGYMRLWVDRKRGLLRQVEQFDENGVRTRWMWVGSIRKINDRWMIKTMEMKRPSTGVQTQMRIDDLETE